MPLKRIEKRYRLNKLGGRKQLDALIPLIMMTLPGLGLIYLARRLEDKSSGNSISHNLKLLQWKVRTPKLWMHYMAEYGLDFQAPKISLRWMIAYTLKLWGTGLVLVGTWSFISKVFFDL